jgi:hypothetical protein
MGAEALNPLFRQAVFDAFGVLSEPGDDRRAARQASLSWLVRMIPDYWEVPEEPSGEIPGFD